LKPQLKIQVIDPDPDYLGIEIFASSDRFAGTTRIYAANDELSGFCRSIEGFPNRFEDQRTHLFGSRETGFVGGFCELRFFCSDGSGHVGIRVEIGDDEATHSEGFGSFTIPTLPAEIDSFIVALKRIELVRSGEATLKR
jgi:hypothetical protein